MIDVLPIYASLPFWHRNESNPPKKYVNYSLNDWAGYVTTYLPPDPSKALSGVQTRTVQSKSSTEE